MATTTNNNDGNTLLRVVSHLCAIAVAIYFIYAAWGKIGPANTRNFAMQISNYKILAAEYVNIPAVILPFVEVFGAIALILPFTRKAGSIIVGGLLLFFIWAVFDAAIVHDLEITCGCTGKGSSQAGWNTIGFDALLFAGVVLSNLLYRPATARAGNPGFQAEPIPTPE